MGMERIIFVCLDSEGGECSSCCLGIDFIG